MRQKEEKSLSHGDQAYKQHNLFLKQWPLVSISLQTRIRYPNTLLKKITPTVSWFSLAPVYKEKGKGLSAIFHMSRHLQPHHPRAKKPRCQSFTLHFHLSTKSPSLIRMNGASIKQLSLRGNIKSLLYNGSEQVAQKVPYSLRVGEVERTHI